VSTDAVQLAVAILRETNTDARLTLALRLCEMKSLGIPEI
jgi:hypothetical protein